MKTMRYLTIALALALPALAPARAAGQTAAQTPPQARARAALPPDVYGQVETIAADAVAQGLPAEPLWDKALEGAAKRVPAQRIPAALTEYVGRLRTARSALAAGPPGLGGELPPGALVAGADALRRGVPAAALGQVREGARTPMALVVLGDLVETGVPVDRAVDVVRAALEQRAADEDMLALGARVRAAMREGQNAGAAADGVGRAIREGRVRRIPPAADPARPPRPARGEPGPQRGGR